MFHVTRTIFANGTRYDDTMVTDGLAWRFVEGPGDSSSDFPTFPEASLFFAEAAGIYDALGVTGIVLAIVEGDRTAFSVTL